MDPQTPADGPSLAQLLLIVRRRWWLAALVWIATVGATAIYTFTSTRLFRPQATIEIRPETPQVGPMGADDPAMLASRMMWDNYYRTQEQLLVSPSLLEGVMKALPDVENDYHDRPDPLTAFAKNIDIEKVRSSFILRVGFVDKDPDKATRVVNMLVSRYLETANQRLRELKADTVELLAKETLPSIRRRVEDADKAVQEFNARSGFIDFQETYQSLVDARRKTSARLTDLRLKRAQVHAEAQALSGYGGDGVSGAYNPAFHTTRVLEPLMQQRARLEEERAKLEKLLKPGHPQVLEIAAQVALVEDRIREAVRGSLKALDTDLDALEREEKALVEEQKRIEGGMAEAGRRLNEFRRLEADLTAAKEVYNAYLKKEGETTATSGASLASVRVVDPAKPPTTPYKPRIAMNLALGALLGLLLGAGAMLLSEQLDDRLRSPQEIETFLRHEVLASIPDLASAKAGAPALLGDDASMAEVEAFRSLRAQLAARLPAGGKVVAVVSPGPGEGKSTVTANLAKVLAMDGRRVLVFDADLRRPSQRSLIGRPDGPGLEDVVRGGATLEQAVQPSALKGVDVLERERREDGHHGH